MKASESQPVPLPRPASVWPTLALLGSLGIWRVWLGWMTAHGTVSALPSWLPGFTPMAALAFGGGFLLPRRLGLVAPLGVLLATDLALNAIYGQSLGVAEMATRYGCLLALAMLGAAGRRLGLGRFGLVAGAVVGAMFFYVFTNTATWVGNTAYPQTFAGWAQALTVGTPGFPPTWVFFRNSLVSDALVSMLLAAVTAAVPRGRSRSEPVAVNAAHPGGPVLAGNQSVRF